MNVSIVGCLCFIMYVITATNPYGDGLYLLLKILPVICMIVVMIIPIKTLYKILLTGLVYIVSLIICYVTSQAEGSPWAKLLLSISELFEHIFHSTVQLVTFVILVLIITLITLLILKHIHKLCNYLYKMHVFFARLVYFLLMINLTFFLTYGVFNVLNETSFLLSSMWKCQWYGFTIPLYILYIVCVIGCGCFSTWKYPPLPKITRVRYPLPKINFHFPPTKLLTKRKNQNRKTTFHHKAQKKLSTYKGNYVLL